MARNELCESALRQLSRIWQVEPKQVNGTDRGFEWVPASHAVLVSADLDEATQRVRLTVETEFLRDTPIHQHRFVTLLDAVAPFWSAGYALVYVPHELWSAHIEKLETGAAPTLTFFSSVYINDEMVSWLPEFFAKMTITQPVFAEAYRNNALSIFEGAIADLRGGICEQPDEILDVVDALYIPAGKTASRWDGSEEFESFAEKYARQDHCFGMGDKQGMSIETPFGSDSALIQFRTHQPHPALGHGLLVTIQIRIGGTKQKVQNEAAFLNFLEARSWTDFPQLGCWHAHERSENDCVLAHSTFIPNLLYMPGLVANLAFWSMARVRWFRKSRFPDLADKTMAEILQERLGLLPGRNQ
jgi:hypothetical protein